MIPDMDLMYAISEHWIFLALLAILPVALLFYYIWRKDHNPEPLKTMAVTFLWGCATVISALAIQFTVSCPDVIGEYFLVVAPSEELGKLAVIWFYIWKHKDFNDSFDAIVYSVMASLGFAAVENVLYVLENGWAVGLMRAVSSVPGHAVFAVFMGYFFGRAKTHFYYGRRRDMAVSLILSYLSAVVVHGTYDCLLTSPQLFVFFVIFVIAIDVAAFKIISHASHHDHPMVMDT